MENVYVAFVLLCILLAIMSGMVWNINKKNKAKKEE